MAFAGLGSRVAPRSYWTAAGGGEAAVADAGAVAEVERISYWVGLGEGSCAVELSRDGAAWERVGLIEQPDVFGYVEWRVIPAAASARYLRLAALHPGLEIGEVGAFGPDGRQVPLAVIEGPTEAFDEPATVVRTPTARTGMYFDETYFARSAWEQLRGLEPTETTHPPLGRTIISIGIALWGMNPFGWRFMGALAGTLSVAVLYLLARPALRKDLVGAPRGLSLRGRLAQVRPEPDGDGRRVRAAVHAARLLVRARARAGRPALAVAAGGRGRPRRRPGVQVERRVPGGRGRGAVRRGRDPQAREASGRGAAAALAGAVARGLVCLAAVPLALYAASWLPWVIGRGATAADVIARHAAMYRYHSTIVETRWYASAWWQWPLDLRPIWLYRGTVDVAADRVASIVTMGNPATWWLGTLALPAVAAIAAARRDRVAAWILVALAAAWLPWAFAARRLTFIYHFLPATPFLILGLVRCFERLADRFPRTRPAAIAFASVAALVFALFLPLLTGTPVPRAYAEALRWLSTWIFFA